MGRVSHADMSQTVISMHDIVKKFGDFVANDGINLTVHKAEVHAILGENGAGKSTLMNVLYGLYRPTAGHIEVNGVKTLIDSPEKALCDLIACSSKVNLRYFKDVETYLQEDIRLNMEEFYRFDANIFEQYIKVGKKANSISTLLKFLQQ